MMAVRDAIYAILEDDHPMTVRGLFYRLVVQWIIAKTETEYKATVVRLASEMRRAGELPYGWLADSTRVMRKPLTFSSLEQAVHHAANAYRRAVWDDQDAYVEVWSEKDTLAGILNEETRKWDVPLMVTRGYPSLSFLHSAAETITAWGRPTYLYYFGDYDPSGMDISRVVERDIRAFAPGVDLHFERLAVTPAQIVDFALPTRPTKQSDSRSKGFAGQSVEVDAIPARMLRQLVRDKIEHHIDPARHKALSVAEESERKIMQMFARQVDGGAA